jgi:hypothetical protein
VRKKGECKGEKPETHSSGAKAPLILPGLRHGQVNGIKTISVPGVTAQGLLQTQESQSPGRRIFPQKWIIRKTQTAGLKETRIFVLVIRCGSF